MQEMINKLVVKIDKLEKIIERIDSSNNLQLE